MLLTLTTVILAAIVLWQRRLSLPSGPEMAAAWVSAEITAEDLEDVCRPEWVHPNHRRRSGRRPIRSITRWATIGSGCADDWLAAIRIRSTLRSPAAWVAGHRADTLWTWAGFAVSTTASIGALLLIDVAAVLHTGPSNRVHQSATASSIT